MAPSCATPTSLRALRPGPGIGVPFDLVLAQTSPVGYGHVYAPQHYLKAWIEVTEPEGWTEPELDALTERLTRAGTYRDIVGGWFRDPDIASEDGVR